MSTSVRRTGCRCQIIAGRSAERAKTPYPNTCTMLFGEERRRKEPMAFGNTVTVVGNATRDPELRFTPSGTPVCTFGPGVEPPLRARRRAGGGNLVLRHQRAGRRWRRTSPNRSPRAPRVIVSGRLEQRSWETPDGEKRNKVEIVADEVAPSLRWASAQVNRNEFREGNGTAPRRTVCTRGEPRSSCDAVLRRRGTLLRQDRTQVPGTARGTSGNERPGRSLGTGQGHHLAGTAALRLSGLSALGPPRSTERPRGTLSHPRHTLKR